MTTKATLFEKTKTKNKDRLNFKYIYKYTSYQYGKISGDFSRGFVRT